MIYCVWYPSGGFGHFVNAVLSLYGENFVRPKNTLNFSSNGNSHSLDLVVPKYYRNKWLYNFEFDNNKNYSVLIDNGIQDESCVFRNSFPNSTVIKICYHDRDWAIVARTCIDKAMNSSIEKELALNGDWDRTDNWAKREKYFLFLRDHQLRHSWKPEKDYCISIEHMLEYDKFYHRLLQFVKVLPFEPLWNHWRQANAAYIDPIMIAHEVINSVRSRRTFNLQHITDLWTQAVIYYYIWLEFGIEVPHNDFANWIDSTDQIVDLL